MLCINLAGKVKLKQVAGCLGNFLGKVEEFGEPREFAEEMRPNLRRGIYVGYEL